MYHPSLEIEIKKWLAGKKDHDPKLKKLYVSVSQLITKLEKEKNNRYQKTNSLEKKTSQLLGSSKKTIENLSDVAQFPLENPNPIFRIASSGDILFLNPRARLIKQVEYAQKKFKINQFFSHITRSFKNEGTFEVKTNGLEFIFYYKKIYGKPYYNVYGADVTEKNTLRNNAEENFSRLKNFLETTKDIYYLFYSKNPGKNIITSGWTDFFGFDPKESRKVFSQRNKYVVTKNEHQKQINQLKIGERIIFKYQVKQPKTGKIYWLSETIHKYHDNSVNDTVISGRITDITKEQDYVFQVQESESRFKKLIDVSPVMIWVSNEHNLVTYSNQALKNFLGISLENLYNYKDYIQFVHPRDKKIAVVEWKKNVNKRLPVQSEFRLKDSQGVYHNVFEKAVPRFYDNGKFAGYIGAYFDLTKEKKYQESLSIENEKFELLTRNSPDIVLLTDKNGFIEYASPTIKKVLGYSESDVINKNLSQIICQECKKHLEKIDWLKNKKNRNQSFQFKMKAKNGKLIWVESLISFVKDKEHQTYKILLHNRDIHEIKKAEDLLIESEQKYRGLFENMHLGVMEVDVNENIQWVNKSFEEMTGYSFKYLKGKNAVSLFLKNTEARKKMEYVGKKRSNRNESIYEIKMKKKSGEILDVVISGSPIIDLMGNVKGSVGIHWDVTEIRKIQRMLEEEKIKTQNEVMKATINSEEIQKQILGNELHDGVGHILTYTSLFLQMASESEKFSPELFSKAHQNVEKAINEVRRISRNLVPPALVDLGLRDAIIELVNQFTELNNIKFKFDCRQEIFKDIQFEPQRNIYRIIQELINNTIKYAQCRLINLKIFRDTQHLYIHYSDDGLGFDTQKVKKGLGIQSINNRVYFYGGNTQLITQKNKGAMYKIEIPLTNLLINKETNDLKKLT